ncbi:MAG: DUF3575 domain-containing protein [Bacteroidales bacterium]
MMNIRCTYIKMILSGLILISCFSGVYAQKKGLPVNKENIIKYRYQTPDYRLPRFPSGYPLRDRFYLFTDVGAEANWEASEYGSQLFFNALVHSGLGFKITPVHGLEAGFLFAAPDKRMEGIPEYRESRNVYGATLNYLLNLTAFGNKSANVQKFEAFALAGVEYRSAHRNTLGVNAGVRIQYNPLPLFGIYAQSGMSVSHGLRDGTGFATRPYLNAGVMFRFGKPQINPADYLPPFAIKTNLLFDLATALNFEIEFPIHNRYSVAAEWVFPWWTLDNHKIDSKRSRMQILNGNLEGRYWFGNRDKKPLLNGWFAGIYSGGGLYDLEWKGKGVQGEFFIAAGLSGGYSHRIAKHLSLEYNIGVGVLSTDYRTYKAHFCEDNTWYAIREKRGRYTWIGPTKAKISLVWMINESKKKGGR